MEQANNDQKIDQANSQPTTQEQQTLYHQPGYPQEQLYNPTQQPYAQPNNYAAQQPYAQPNYYATQQPYMQPYAQPDPQIIENLKNAVGEMDKAIHGANGVVIFIAVLNIAIGVLLTFFPDIISGDGVFSDFVGGIYYIIPALLFAGLSFGVVRRSRTCLLIASIYMILDAVFALLAGGFGTAIGFLVMRVFLVISLLAGTRFSFRFHSVVKEHALRAGIYKSELIKALKPKIQKWQIITCAVLACVGIGTAVYGFTGDAYVEGRKFEDWVEYTSGPVTVRMPSSVIWDQSEAIPDLPGALYLSAYSETQAGNVVLITYQNILNPTGFFTAEDAHDLEYAILSDLVYDIGANVIDNYEGTFPGNIRFVEVNVDLGYEFGTLRSFTIGNDIFVTGVFLPADKDREFIDLFLTSIRIN